MEAHARTDPGEEWHWNENHVSAMVAGRGPKVGQGNDKGTGVPVGQDRAQNTHLRRKSNGTGY